MKKTIFSCLAFVAIATAVTFSSCTKEDPAEGVQNYNATSQTATIEGYILIKANYVDSTTQADQKIVGTSAISSSKIQITIPYSDLHPTNAQFYSLNDNWTGTAATYDATTGKFTATVPTSEKGVQPTITVTGFVANWTYEWHRSSTLTDSTVVKTVLWEGTTVPVPAKIYPAQSVVLEPVVLTPDDYKTTSEIDSNI